ncbi:PetM family of cytochrome b6f complex subunit 7 [Microvirga sp. ACRRW]|uniref:PetM family of cytochrome b6f complex subunit 7 n=1 Tax=Microvirga sp. ACRRW TaxID=2918205 RepID=UPI001EF63D0E|nr:PetM family of cytochrome b6f complex subunit 7 [Microvirga sp. ACRRW]MCG7393387.1 PetM family of cytochrome b6f complex subunit 7 [Microvirga sp. ACRRW]
MKFLARSLGLLLVAAGFIGLVIDGTRSIVNHAVSFVSISDAAGTLVQGGPMGFERLVAARVYPWLWDPFVSQLLLLPASITGFILGALLLWAGQKPLEPIGYLAGR